MEKQRNKFDVKPFAFNALESDGGSDKKGAQLFEFRDLTSQISTNTKPSATIIRSEREA